MRQRRKLVCGHKYSAVLGRFSRHQMNSTRRKLTRSSRQVALTYLGTLLKNPHGFIAHFVGKHRRCAEAVSCQWLVISQNREEVASGKQEVTSEEVVSGQPERE